MKFEMTAPLEVGIACSDLARLRRFYEGVLGFSFVSEFVVPAEKAVESALSSGGYTVVRLQTSFGERLKLLAPNKPLKAAAPTPYVLDKANAVYLTFIVVDIDAAISRLLEEGIEFMTGKQRVEVRPGVYLAFCRDPEGNVLELVQYENIANYRSELRQTKED